MIESMKEKGAGRMKEAGFIALAVLIVISFVWPERFGVVLWKAFLLAGSAYAGYWIDRLVFRADRRPHRLLGPDRSHAEYRRAIIVAAALLSVSQSL